MANLRYYINVTVRRSSIYSSERREYNIIGQRGAGIMQDAKTVKLYAISLINQFVSDWLSL